VCNNNWQNAFVGQTISQATSPNGNGYIEHLYNWSASWIAFEFENTEVVVEISKADGSPIQSAKVRPEGFASEAVIENGKAYVTFSSHKNINVDIDGQLEDQYTGMFYAGQPVHTISLFGNPIFHVPDTNNSNVYYLQPGDSIPGSSGNWDTIYFAPGVHHIGTPYEIASNKTLYIPGNAIVHGTIHPPSAWGAAEQWSVYGSGAISGEEIPHWSVGTLDGTLSKTFTGSASSVHLEGFVVIDPAHHTFNMINSDFNDTSKANIYKNLKILAWRLNSDGLNAFTNSEVSDCFFRCQDDIFYYGSEHVKIRDCVTWADYNGHVVKVIWGGSPAGGSYFKNIRSIYHRAGWHYWSGGRVVAFNDLEAGGTFENIIISNILVEDPYPSLPAFNFFTSNPNNSIGPTVFNNVLIEKVIQLNGGMPNAWGDATFGAPQNQMFGSDSAGMFSNILFKNCYYNGQWIGSFQDGAFLTNNFIQNVNFLLDDTLSINPPAYLGSVNASLANVPATPIISGSNPVTLCDGSSITLTSSSVLNNQWSTGANSQTIIVDQAGDYFVEVSNGICVAQSASTFVELVAIQNNAIQPQNALLNINDSMLFYTAFNDSNATYQWQIDTGTGFQNMSNSAQFTGVNNDTLMVNYVLTNNHNNHLRCIVTIDVCADTSNSALIEVNAVTSNHHHLNQTNFSVYPIPSSSLINVLCKNGYKVYSLKGELLLESNEPATQIDISALAEGMYYLSANNDFVKIIKIKD
jgi:hypothetical protein